MANGPPPTWQRHDWQRFIRHDAHRFVKPEPIQRKTYAERLVEQRRAQEEEALAAAEQEALCESLAVIRRELAELKFELACRRIFHKYDPSQPRVPKGDPKGGQWAKEGGGDAGKDPDSGIAQGEITDVSAARRRRSGASEAECDAQYKQDKIICNLVRTPLCWAQAAERYAACLSGRPLPPFNF